MANRLIHESSPYLLQHAHNPVDWYPWGEEALEKAKKEGKPILVSIGYSACHWCHVMERESFENEETAAFMNERFINIKIDREERPDLDHIYMDAVQAITGSGGWPLNVFLTPETKPFFGGTYFPPRRAYNRSSWREVLEAISVAFRERRSELDAQAEQLTTYLSQSNHSVNEKQDAPPAVSREMVDQAFTALMQLADRNWGGFGGAPKFPQSFSIQFLLRYHYVTGSEEALAQASLSLDKMISGGIYDQLGGGFARYSTDNEWLIPHFEKMLYDNALLLSVLSEAYQLTGNGEYLGVINETIDFIKRELMGPSGEFYAALDADSEGEEGKFYTWDYEEVNQLTGENSSLIDDYFDVHPGGNLPHEWKGKSILRRLHSPTVFAEKSQLSVNDFSRKIQAAKDILLTARNRRVRPGLDDKILLSWNALMNTACSKAFEATGKEEYKQLAISNMNFLLSSFRKDGDQFFHSWKNGQGKHSGNLDDYAFLIQAALQLQQVTGEQEWLRLAKRLTEYVILNFSDEKSVFFFFTDINQMDVIVRKTEIYDGATPSGNATMAYNLHQLSILFNISGWSERSEKMITSLSSAAVRYPTSFGIWTNLMLEITQGTDEIVIIGRDVANLAKQVLADYIPHKVLMSSTISNEKMPLLVGKPVPDQAVIYLCRDSSCMPPVYQADELHKLVSNRNKN